MNEIRLNNSPIIGIHIRSIAQKKAHDPNYLNKYIDDRLLELKTKIEKQYSKYEIFIMTDVNHYIEKSKQIFDKINYFENIARIDNEDDSIPSLGHLTGYKLGADIINECYALSLCDKIFVSNSNIPYIISLINPSIDMEEY